MISIPGSQHPPLVSQQQSPACVRKQPDMIRVQACPTSLLPQREPECPSLPNHRPSTLRCSPTHRIELAQHAEALVLALVPSTPQGGQQLLQLGRGLGVAVVECQGTMFPSQPDEGDHWSPAVSQDHGAGLCEEGFRESAAAAQLGATNPGYRVIWNKIQDLLGHTPSTMLEMGD